MSCLEVEKEELEIERLRKIDRQKEREREGRNTKIILRPFKSGYLPHENKCCIHQEKKIQKLMFLGLFWMLRLQIKNFQVPATCFTGVMDQTAQVRHIFEFSELIYDQNLKRLQIPGQ